MEDHFRRGVIDRSEHAVFLEQADALHDLVIEALVQARRPAAGDLGHQLIEVLTQKLGDDPGEAVQLPLLDLVDLDPKPGCSIDPGLDVDPRLHVEAKLPPPFGRLRAPADSLRDGTGHRGMKFPLDLAGDQKPAGARVDRDEPIRVDRASIFVRLLEGSRRELCDNAVEEILAELDLSRGLCRPAMQKHRAAEHTEDNPSPPPWHRHPLSQAVR